MKQLHLIQAQLQTQCQRPRSLEVDVHCRPHQRRQYLYLYLAAESILVLASQEHLEIRTDDSGSEASSSEYLSQASSSKAQAQAVNPEGVLTPFVARTPPSHGSPPILPTSSAYCIRAPAVDAAPSADYYIAIPPLRPGSPSSQEYSE